MKEIPYASAIDSLMFALVYTRPDIRYAVGLLDRYQSNPGLEHWKAVKNVMKCLQGTKEYKFMYRHTDQLEVIGYSDSDFARCVGTRKSTSGYIYFFLSRGAISWRSTNQTLVASFTMEENFVGCYKATTQALWLRNFTTGLKIVNSISRTLNIFCDRAAIFFLRIMKVEAKVSIST